ncbi:hypothetical protein DOY81_011192, partial [Sarcophaga bullata]
ITELCGFIAARSPKLFILDPKLVQQILIQNFNKFRDNESSQWSSKKVGTITCLQSFCIDR